MGSLQPRAIALAALMLSGVACATTPKTVAAEPETVGQLAPSYASIATAPVHHDEPPGLGSVVETGDDADDTGSITTTSAGSIATSGSTPVELPQVAPKTDGVTIGGAR
jgi:hypothetical protein